MDAAKILKKSKLSLTKNRINILHVLGKSNHALSENEIAKMLEEDCDRTTIYRTLTTLSKSKIIHKIIDDNQNKYVYEASGPEENQNEHGHFKCNRCGKVVCLHDVSTDHFPLPEGYIKVESNLLIMGICNKCNLNNSNRK